MDFNRFKSIAWSTYFAACIAMLVFAYGVAVGTYKIFPYRVIEQAAAAAVDWWHYTEHNLRLRPEKFLAAKPVGSETSASTSAERAYHGVTFVTGFFDQSLGMRLLDMDHNVLHEWRVSFNDIWPNPSHIDNELHDWDTQIHGAILYPDGDVVFNFQYGGLVRIDKCGTVEWTLPRQTHHSIFEDHDGFLWVPSRELRTDPDGRYAHLPAPFQEEFILKITPDGEVLEEISILDLIYDANYEGVLFANGLHDAALSTPLDGDFTHLNDIEVLSPQKAAAFPWLESGDIMISLRNLNLLLVIDAIDKSIKWSMTGPFLRQHDPDFLSNGKISVFDNRRDGADGEIFGGSRILEIDPVTRKISVRYGRKKHRPFFTETMGDHQYLPNGNLLITESEAGHAFEVATDGEIVSSFVNHWDEESAALIGRATRYPAHYLSSIRSGECT